MVLNIILYIVVCFLVGITTFGGGQVFYVIFNSLFTLLLTPVVANELVTVQDWDWGLIFSSVTPGPVSTHLTAYLAILVSKQNIALSLLIMIISYVVITLPATIIMVSVDKRVTMKSNQFQYLTKLLKPAVIAILFYLIIDLVFSIANFNLYTGTAGNGPYSFITGNWVEIIKVSVYFIVDFSLAVFIFLKCKKINPLWVILCSGVVGFCIFYFIH
ncbi:chromate transporter [Spiroplasma endosymbiont of Stenodema calcarata]|uniref:chromate transporter n=1 Tax=Spiroplasma endosymbiont of Stenodema calcarata TaxID=3139328 RepID=UPI003CCA74D5